MVAAEVQQGKNSERPVVFRCEGAELIGIVNYPDNATRGIVLISGGDQYRVGSHRLFVQLARNLAAAGIAVMRYDHRGIGDNSGKYDGFENTFPDIKSAVEKFLDTAPSLEHIILCGLCDGASSALMASHQLEQVDGLILINPWVHTSNLEARARIDGYYISRLRGQEFWKRLFTGRINVISSLLSLGGYLLHFLKSSLDPEATMMRSPSYVYRMLVGLRRFKGPILIALSGKDLVAQEFREQLRVDERWNAIVNRDGVQSTEFTDADHSFTSVEQRQALEATITQWSLDRSNATSRQQTT